MRLSHLKTRQRSDLKTWERSDLKTWHLTSPYNPHGLFAWVLKARPLLFAQRWLLTSVSRVSR